MAHYTKAQVEKWEAFLHNGFRMNVRKLLQWGEKTATTHIDLDEGKYLYADLFWRKQGNGYVPCLHLSIWEDAGNGMMRSSGLGHYINLNDHPVARRNWKELSFYSTGWPSSKIIKEAMTCMPQLLNPSITPAV